MSSQDLGYHVIGCLLRAVVIKIQLSQENSGLICPYCNGDVDNELHGLFECNSATLLNLKNTFLPRILCRPICSQVHKLSVYDRFFIFDEMS